MSGTYTVTIVKRTSELRVVQGEWGIIDNRPYTQQEADNALMSSSWEEAIKEVYGYKPDREEEVVGETKVLEQTVETLDINQVIRAINGL